MKSGVFSSFWPVLLLRVIDPVIPVGFKPDGYSLVVFGGGYGNTKIRIVQGY